MNRTLLCGGSAARIFTGYGPKPVADNPERIGAEILKRLDEMGTETKSVFSKTGEQVTELDKKFGEANARLTEIEQKMVRRAGSGDRMEAKTAGERFIESEEFKSLAASPSQRGRVQVKLERKDITSVSGSAGGLVRPDFRPDIVNLQRQRLFIRNLVAPGQTSGNLVIYPRQLTRSLNAAFVAEEAVKPSSDMTFVDVNCPVKTLAHVVYASRQIMDDALQLSSFVDAELRYGLALVEENQFLNGDGTGQNILGIIPQASTYSAPFAITGETDIDRISLALGQCELASIYPDAVVLHPTDWRKICLNKDAQGRYIMGDPIGQGPQTIWGLPVVRSLAMTAGTFLVGAFFEGAQVFDRLEAEILLSTEDQDNFIRNKITIRGEERLAFTVKKPWGFVTGTLPQ